MRTAYAVLLVALVATALAVQSVDAAHQAPTYLVWAVFFGGLIISGLMFGMLRTEINARTQAEQSTAELRRSQAAFEAEKERLAVTLESISDGVITTDMAGMIVSINKAAAELTGWTQPEVAGLPLAEVFPLLNEQTRESVPNTIENILRAERVVELQNYVVLVARQKTERIIASSAAPIHDRDGKVIGVVLVFRDVTGRRRNEEETVRQSKLESVGLLAGGIAHDFNNILLAIVGNISLARMSTHSTDKLLERLDAMEKAALRAKDLTQQLLTFAHGGQPIKKTTQIADLIREACQSMLLGSNVQSEINLPDESCTADIDAGQFRQAFRNLIVNAMQSMPEGGKIEVRAEKVELSDGFLPSLPAGRYVKISVRDHGEGIAPAELARIFEPYFAVPKRRNGLGLAAVYSVIRKHGGQIKVESVVGLGTTFHLYLPDAVPVAGEPVPTPAQQKMFGRGRLLVMDDEEELLNIISEMLVIFGYEVETAKDGAEAIDRYMKAKSGDKPFDAVIMDLTVPNGLGGRDAIRRLRELDPQVRAIVSSGYSLDPVMANYRQYGFVGIIPKPYRMEELRRELEDVLSKARD
jgi:PAS domain S-box-containing protein